MRHAAVAAASLVLLTSACGGDGRPERLLYGEHASEFAPVSGSVLTQGRVLTRAMLGRRVESCRGDPPPRARIIERVGVFGESLTFANADGTMVYACDGGVDPAGEQMPPWCGFVVGRAVAGRLLDPRLDVLCRDRNQRRIAYAFVVPVAGALWVGVEQDGYTEIYEVLADLPVRVATASGIDVDRARAVFEVTQYDARGRELVRGELEALVAG